MSSKARKPAPDRLDLDQLGELENYYDDELADVREKLIDDIARIEQENRVIDGRIKEFNRRKQELAHERAERSKAIRVGEARAESAAAQRLAAATAARGGAMTSHICCRDACSVTVMIAIMFVINVLAERASAQARGPATETRSYSESQVIESEARWAASAELPSVSRKQRRARYLIAAGVGFVVGSAVHAGMFLPRHICGDSERDRYRGPRVSAGIGAGVGLSFIISGGIWLRHENRRLRQSPSMGQKVGLGMFSLGMAVASQIPLLISLLPETGALCSS